MNKILKIALKKEIKIGLDFYKKENYKKAFYHFERSHIIGQ